MNWWYLSGTPAWAEQNAASLPLDPCDLTALS